MEEERRQKVLAGKEMLADYVQKKNRQEDKRKRKKNMESGSVQKDPNTGTSTVGLSDVEEMENQGQSPHSQSEGLLEGQLEAWHTLLNENKENEAQASVIEQGPFALSLASLEETLSVSDFKTTMEEYSKKLQEYKLALQQRDDLIAQLSERLQVTLANRDQVQLEATTQAENLEKEISFLKLQLQQASDVLSKQKSQNGISASELFESQNQGIWLKQENERKDVVIKDLCTKLNYANGELERLQLDFKLEVAECEQRLISLESDLQKESVFSGGELDSQQNMNLSGEDIPKNGIAVTQSVEVQTEYEYFVVDILTLQLDIERIKNDLHSLKDVGTSSDNDQNKFGNGEASVNPETLELKIVELKNLLNTYSTEMSSPKWNCSQDRNVFSNFVDSVELRLSAITEAGILLMASSSEETKLKAENKDLCLAVNQLNELVDKLTTEKIQIQEEQNVFRTSSPIEKFRSEDQNISVGTETDYLGYEFEDRQLLPSVLSKLELLVKEKDLLACELDQLKNLYGEIIVVKEELSNFKKIMADLNIQISHLGGMEDELQLTEVRLSKISTGFEKLDEDRQRQEDAIRKLEEKMADYNVEIDQLNAEKKLLSDSVNSLKITNTKLEESLNIFQEQREAALRDLEVKITEKHETELQEKDINFKRQLDEDRSQYESRLNEAKLHFEKVVLEMMSKCSQLENEKIISEKEWEEKYQDMTEEKVQLEMELSSCNANSVSHAVYEELLQQLRNFQNIEVKLKLIQDEKESVYSEKLNLQQEIEKLRNSNAVLQTEKCDIEQELSMKILNLSRLQVDVIAQLEEAKTDLELTESAKKRLEDEVKTLRQSILSLEMPGHEVSFEQQSLFELRHIGFQDKFDLACEERNKLQKQVASFAKKNELQEALQSDLVKQLQAMKEQMKTALLEQQGLCRDLMCLAEKKQQLEIELKQTKKALEESIATEEAEHITVRNVKVLDALEEELVDIETGHSDSEHGNTWEVSEKSDLVVECYSEEHGQPASLEASVCSETEIAVSDQKMVLLLESSQQLMHEKEILENHVLQLEKMITDMGLFLDQQLHSLTQDDAQEWINQLKIHRDKLIEELHCFHNASLNFSGWLANNSTLEETLKQQKEFLLEKVHEKERLEEDVIHLRKAVERCEHVMKTLEEKLAQRHAVEQELSRHNQMLESELREIELKLREKEESLASQKIHLQSELKWKDLELKAKELDLQQKMLELENREQQISMERVDVCLQKKMELKEKEWNQMQELRKNMENYHSSVVSGLMRQLERDNATVILKLQEEHAAESAQLRSQHQQQINDLINKMTEHLSVSCEEDSQISALDKEWRTKFDCLDKSYLEEVEKTRLEMQVVQAKLLIEQRSKIEEQIKAEFKFELQRLKAENSMILLEVQNKVPDGVYAEDIVHDLSSYLDAKFSDHIQGMTKLWQEVYINYLSDLHSQLSSCFQELSLDSHSLPTVEQEATDLIKRREIILSEASVMKDYISFHYKELVTLRQNLQENVEKAIEFLHSNIQLKESMFKSCETQTTTDGRLKEEIDEPDKEIKALLDSVIREKDFCHIKEMEKLNFERAKELETMTRKHREELEALQRRLEEEKMHDKALLLNEISSRGEEFRNKCVEEVDQTWLLKLDEMNTEHSENIRILKDQFEEERTNLCSENIEKVKKLINKQNLEIEDICAKFDRDRENDKWEWAKREKELQLQLDSCKTIQQITENAGENQVHELEEVISDLNKHHKEELDSYRERMEDLLKKIASLENKLAHFLELESRVNELRELNQALGNEVEKLKQEKEEAEFGYQQQIYDLIEDHSKEVKYEKEKANALLQQSERQKDESIKSLETKHYEEVRKLSKELSDLQHQIHEHGLPDLKYSKENCSAHVDLRELEELREKLETNFCEERAQMSLAHQRELDELTAKYEKEQEILRISVSELQGELQKIAEATLETVPTTTSSFDDVFENIFCQIEQLTNDTNVCDLQNAQYPGSEKIYRMKEVLKTEVEKYVSAQLMLQSDCSDDVYEEPRYDTFYRDLQPIQELDELEYGMDDVDPQFMDIPKSLCVSTDTSDLHLEKDEAAVEVENLKEVIQQNIADQQNESIRVAQEIDRLKEQISKVEEHNLSLQAELAKIKEESSPKSKPSKGGREWLADTELSSVDMHMWQVHAAQTNSRLMHVLSDLIQTFVDTEKSIQQRLFNLGLQLSDTGLLQEDDNGPPSGHFHGSREDFANFSQGEGPSLELCDDDLTPRAWDRFAAAIGSQDLEAEGEDVLLGASRRLRSTVEHVLALLSELVESQQSRDLGEQLEKNDELMRNMKEEAQTNEYLRMELLRAEGALKSLEHEKQILEDKLLTFQEKVSQQSKDLSSFQKQMSRLEEQNDSLSGENSLLEQQNVTLSSKFSETEIKELLEEQTRLGRESLSQKQQNERERQRLLSRIHQLEVSLEEVTSQKEEILEEKTKEIEDLKTQMEAMEKQLFSNRKFINEQAHDREQEREEFTREIAKLQSSIRDKERNQATEKQLAKDVENLEQQLKRQAKALQENAAIRDQLETELKNSIDKISDLHDVISELESQLDSKAKTQKDLQGEIASLKSALSKQEEGRGELHHELDQAKQGVIRLELVERVQLLESQLDSRDQKLEQLNQCQNLLQEFRGQIHVLDEKVESKIRQLSRYKLRAVTASPVSSEDTSTSDSREQESHLMIQEGRVLSPSSLHWEEIKRFEAKIDLLLAACDDLQRKCVDFEIQMRKAKCYEEELCQEKAILQQQLSEHLLQISTLRTHIEAKRYDTRRSKVASAVVEELNQVKERVLREQAHREKAERLFKDSSDKVSVVEEHLERERQRVFELEMQMATTHQECLNLREERDTLKAQIADVSKLSSVDKEDFSMQTSFCHIESTQEPASKTEALEKELQEMRKMLSTEREASSRQMCVLLKEIENLSRHQEGGRMSDDRMDSSSKVRKNLQGDFDSLHEMYKEKVDELQGIEKEIDNQLELENTVESLKSILLEEKKKCVAYMAEAAELKEKVEQLNEENRKLQQLQERCQTDHLLKKINDDNDELKAKITDLIHEETQKQLYKSEDKHKQELDSLLQKHEEEVEQIQKLLSDEGEKVRIHVVEGMQWKTRSEHLERLCALETESKSKMEKLLSDCREKIKQLMQDLNQRAEELGRTLAHHQEELSATREKAAVELEAERKLWKEERMQLELRFDGERQELVRKHEMQLLDLEARHKSECQVLSTSHNLQLKQLKEEKESLEKKNHMKDLEVTYQDKVKHIRDMLHRSKAHSTLLSRESTPDSDTTSSSVATSTGDEHYSLPRPIQKLFDKVLKEGIEVLSLTECQQLRDHLTPDGGGHGDARVQNMDIWQTEKEIILQQIKTLASLTFPEPMEREKILQDLYTVFHKEKDRISIELKMFAEHPFSMLGFESIEEKLQQLESHIRVYGKLLNDSIMNSKSSLDREMVKNQQLEKQVFLLKEQVAKDSWQIRTQKEMLEFRSKQEKSQIGELQIALDSEKVHNSQLQAQLQQQRSVCTELQMALSSAKAEVTRLQYLCSQVKKEAENNKNLYDVEKSHTLSLMKALEMERASFSQVQMTLESERRQNKSLHSQSQHVIQELRTCVARHAVSSSSGLMSPPELLRNGANSSRSLDILIPSLSYGENFSTNSEQCLKCLSLKATLDTERVAWANQESALTKTLANLEEQLRKMSKFSSKEDLQRPESVVSQNKILALYYKYRHSEHHRQSLINQKKYLFRLLKGYEITESAALRVLSKMGMCTPQGSVCSYSPHADGSKHSRFRAAIYTVVAILRMKFLVRRTKKTFYFVDTFVKDEIRLPSPSSQQLGAWMAQHKNDVSPSLSSSSSVSSGTISLSGRVVQSLSRPTSSRSGRLASTSWVPSKKEDTTPVPQKISKLSEYVSRLSQLHKSLGLEDSS